MISMLRYCASIFVVLCFLPFPAFSQDLSVAVEYSVFEPVLKDSAVQINPDATPPEEPNIVPVQFLKVPTVTALELRVDQLLQGIKTDTPPEYDHYGYEIRRYMSHIGNPAIFEDDKRLIEEIANVKKARVIVSYWQKALDAEVMALEKLVNESGENPALRTSFKQNKSTVRSFVVALQGWVDANERFLVHAYEIGNLYENFYPEIVFVTQTNDRIDFYNNFVLKQSKLTEIRKYGPFGLMVY